MVRSSALTRTDDGASLFFQKVPPPEPSVVGLCSREGAFLVINVSSDDKIQILNADQGIMEALTQEVADNYEGGIQDVTDDTGTRTIKLSGYPWRGTGEQKTQGIMIIHSSTHGQGRTVWLRSLQHCRC